MGHFEKSRAKIERKIASCPYPNNTLIVSGRNVYPVLGQILKNTNPDNDPAFDSMKAILNFGSRIHVYYSDVGDRDLAQSITNRYPNVIFHQSAQEPFYGFVYVVHDIEKCVTRPKAYISISTDSSYREIVSGCIDDDMLDRLSHISASLDILSPDRNPLRQCLARYGLGISDTLESATSFSQFSNQACCSID